MQKYLIQHCDEEINNLLNGEGCSMNISLTHLQRQRPDLYLRLLQDNQAEQRKWNAALLEAQKTLFEGNMYLEAESSVKDPCHARFINMPSGAAQKSVPFPSIHNVGQFLQIKGNVFRRTDSKFLEFKRDYTCSRCKELLVVEAEYGKMYVFDVPRACPNHEQTGCKGTLQWSNSQQKAEYFRDYQDIRIQEISSERNVPRTQLVTLEGDLVDSCLPGDCVAVVGTVEQRWAPLVPGKKTTVAITIKANSISKEGNKAKAAKDLSDDLIGARSDWMTSIERIGEFSSRDMLVQSICPEVHGMYPVKLAIALSLASCTDRALDNGVSIRGHSHLLLVGDPGLAKSRLLRFAADISGRAVFTTGMGCSKAGLTAAAVKENNERHLEAGALVLADGGVCCIDEFNLMSETDKASIHEAMEQQVISIAKAGLTCKLSSRCVVLAAMNPKNPFSASDEEAHLGVGGPLLSRFDLILVLRDERDSEWDDRVGYHILALSVEDDVRHSFEDTPPEGYWDMQRLQVHFQAVRDIHPQISDGAKSIICAYYQAYRENTARNLIRTSVRLLDSLYRLAKAHARLLFREVVLPIDAIIVIRLMETTWGMGLLGLPRMDLIRGGIPLGPTQDEIAQVLAVLGLREELGASVLEECVDWCKVEQYQQEILERRKVKSAKEKCETLSSQRMAEFDDAVLKDLDNQKSEAGEKRKNFEEGDLYSKYSFTQQRKQNVKRLKRADPVETSTDDLNIDQVDCILSSLRRNFVADLSKATQPATQSQSRLPSATPSQGKSSAVMNESFDRMLSLKSLLDDDDDDDGYDTKDDHGTTSLNTTLSNSTVFDGAATVSQFTTPSPSSTEDPPPRTNLAADDPCEGTSRFTFKRSSAPKTAHNGNASIATTSESNPPLELETTSRYSFKSVKKPLHVAMTQESRRAEDWLNDLDSQTSSTSQRKDEPEKNAQDKGKLSERTMASLQSFAYVPKQPDDGRASKDKENEDSKERTQTPKQPFTPPSWITDCAGEEADYDAIFASLDKCEEEYGHL